MYYVRELRKGGIDDFSLSALNRRSSPAIPSLDHASGTGPPQERTTQSLDSRSHFLPIISVRGVGVDALNRPFSPSERREVATIMH